MSSEKLRNEILAARDRRQVLLEGYLAQGYPATIVLSLNIPGPDKILPGVDGLFSWALRCLDEMLPIVRKDHQPDGVLGPLCFMMLELEPSEVKQRCMAVETAQSFGRLLDIDVYDGNGRQVDRGSLGVAPRRCLVCNLPATECIRLGRHTIQEVIKKTDEYLAHFRY
jgi:holo-ACP synthase CitX